MARLLRALAVLATASCLCEAYCPTVAPTVARRAHVRSTARMAAQALNNQVVVELQVEPSKSSGGIMLPTTFDQEETEGAFQRKPLQSGTVVSVGPGVVTERGVAIPIPGISEGQRVVIKGGVEGIKLDPKDYDSPLYLFSRAGAFRKETNGHWGSLLVVVGGLRHTGRSHPSSSSSHGLPRLACRFDAVTAVA